MRSLLFRCPVPIASIVIFLACSVVAVAQPPGVIYTESNDNELHVSVDVVPLDGAV